MALEDDINTCLAGLEDVITEGARRIEAGDLFNIDISEIATALSALKAYEEPAP
jgi:hypothetical protein